MKQITLPLKTLLLGAAGIVVIMAVSCFGVAIKQRDLIAEYNKTFTAYQDTVVKPALQRSDSLKRLEARSTARADSMSRIAQRQTITINRLQASVSNLRTQNDSLEVAIGPLPPECADVQVLINGLKTEIDTLSVLRDSLVSRDTTRVKELRDVRLSLSYMTTDRDSLRKVIVNWPKPPKPKPFLKIFPHISAETAFGIGILGTAGAAVWFNNRK